VQAPSASLDTIGALAVKNVPIETWDDSGLGIEPNNLVAINSLIAYRSLRYGQHLDLILTDQHSFYGEDPTMRRAWARFTIRRSTGCVLGNPTIQVEAKRFGCRFLRWRAPHRTTLREGWRPIHELELTVQVSASARAAQKGRIVRVAFDRIALFLPQGNHRIDERGAARRNETCQGCDRRQNQRYSGDSREVVGAKTVEQRGQ
jgi:hypothetical protein